MSQVFCAVQRQEISLSSQWPCLTVQVRNLFCAIALGLGFASAANAAELAIEVVGVRSDAGVIRVALCADEECYKNNGPFVANAQMPADQAGARTVIDNLSPGEYAAVFYHDEDNDAEFDKGWFVPKEGFGFSNDIEPVFGRPPFYAVKFFIPQDGTAITMRVQYF